MILNAILNVVILNGLTKCDFERKVALQQAPLQRWNGLVVPSDAPLQRLNGVVMPSDAPLQRLKGLVVPSDAPLQRFFVF